ncbi:uncharacterized protein LOC144143310 [Haemaphysalis longicornis]
MSATRARAHQNKCTCVHDTMLTMSRAVFNECLIAEVERRPRLWNTRLQDYRNAALRDSLWMEVAASLQGLEPGAAHFGLTLEPYIAATPPEMLHHLQIELLHIASSYSRGIYPNSLMLTTFPRVDMHDE